MNCSKLIFLNIHRIIFVLIILSINYRFTNNISKLQNELPEF